MAPNNRNFKDKNNIEPRSLGAEVTRSIITYSLPVHLSYIWVTGMTGESLGLQLSQSSYHLHNRVEGTLASQGPECSISVTEAPLLETGEAAQKLGPWAKYEPHFVPV